jgi:hypothetical protein
MEVGSIYFNEEDIDMALGAKATAILTKASNKTKASSGDKDKGKVVVFRVPSDLYCETIAKRARLMTEAADKGDTSNISINDIMIMALKAFNKEVI